MLNSKPLCGRDPESSKGRLPGPVQSSTGAAGTVANAPGCLVALRAAAANSAGDRRVSAPGEGAPRAAAGRSLQPDDVNAATRNSAATATRVRLMARLRFRLPR